MADEQRTREARHTVRRVRNYWYRAGVPRRVRRDKAEELRTHLDEALDEGSRIEDVVGDDLAAFASDWAEAERPRPLLDVFLQFVAALTLLPGGLALLHPWLNALFGQQDPRIGVPVGFLGLFAIFIPVFGGWGLVRVLRHRLTTQQTALVGVLLFAAFTVLFFVTESARVSEAFVAVPPATAWTLVAIGVASQGTASWLKRRR
jgi:hypothetical protein